MSSKMNNYDYKEDFRIEIDIMIRDFLASDNVDHLTFPTDLSNLKRKYIHEKCRKMGIKSKSTGKEPNRRLSIYKKLQRNVQGLYNLTISDEAVKAINKLFIQTPEVVRSNMRNSDNFEGSCFGRLNIGDPMIAERAYNNPYQSFREILPVYEKRRDLLQMIENYQVVIVSAETGSGKTTQIPQYILEDAYEKQKPCRVICTQPRRISTLSVAARVAAERGEDVGCSVGYQIKLDSKMGPQTGIVYCTTGILLRTLMNGDYCYRSMTHIIIDEIHERDKFSDFLLICLKLCLNRHPALRIILMSATLDVDLYKDYFGHNVQAVFVPGRAYPIREFFLDEILPMLNYESEAMSRNKAAKLNSLHNVDFGIRRGLDESTTREMDEALRACMDYGTEETFTHVMQLLLCESVPINFVDGIFGYSPLMVAAAHGNIEFMDNLINMGADITLTSVNGHSALNWAENSGNLEAVALLQMYSGPNEMDAESLLSLYDCTISDEVIDFDLIVTIIKFIYVCLRNDSTILIFLPGYDDIMTCLERIRENLNMRDFHVCLMHGSMSMESQKEVFAYVPNKQKIILATNVAETSITIDNVRFVIDSGRAKEKTYDSLSGSSALTTTWISMASVRQRAGRAGRVEDGFCFHIFSKNRYESFNVNNTPEILRVPLHELCLQTKMLAPAEFSIAEFLSCALEPPPNSSITKAISSLITLGALDEFEQLTPLGKHLVQFSVEPHLGKMLIYASVLKCLDPVLSIVACLAHKDPFVLPSKAHLKNEALLQKKALSHGSLSDHMSFLMCFNEWQDAKVSKKEASFCASHFVSAATMMMIQNTRIQLLGQLRASGFVTSYPRDTIFELNTNSNNWGVVKAALVAGLYPNIAFNEDGKLHTISENKIIIHSSSSLRNSICDSKNFNDDAPKLWVVFEELSRIGRMCHVKCCTAVTPTTICLVGGSCPTYSFEENIMGIDDTMAFSVPMNSIIHFRDVINRLVDKRVRNTRVTCNYVDERIVRTFAIVMSAEEQASHLTHPPNIGARPKIIYPTNIEYRKMHNPESSNIWSWRSNNNGDNHSSYRRDSHNRAPRRYDSGHNGSNDLNRRDSTGHNYTRQHPYHPQNGGGPTRENITNGASSSAQLPGNPGPSRPPIPPRRESNSLINVFASDITISERTLFYVIMPNEIKNINISLSQSTWNFSPQTEKKLFKNFNANWTILLLFTVRGSKMFQGVARLAGTNNGIPNNPSPIQWLGTNSVSYNRVKNLLHPKVHIYEDGLQLDFYAGKAVARMLMESPTTPPPNSRPVLGAV